MSVIEDQIFWIKVAISAAEVAGFSNTAAALCQVLAQEVKANAVETIDEQTVEKRLVILSH